MRVLRVGPLPIRLAPLDLDESPRFYPLVTFEGLDVGSRLRSYLRLGHQERAQLLGYLGHQHAVRLTQHELIGDRLLGEQGLFVTPCLKLGSTGRITC